MRADESAFCPNGPSAVKASSRDRRISLASDSNSLPDFGTATEPVPASPETCKPLLPAAPDGPVTLKRIEKLCDLVRLPDAGRQYVRRAFLNGPSRRVQAGRGNICARYPSRKMGRVIQAESLIELAVVLNGEHTAAVAALLDQPPAVRLHYALADGRRQPYWQTPDFLIIGDESFRLVQCKTETDLRKLSDRNPDRWVQEASGRWRFPPGEAAARDFGFAFEVVSDADIRPAYTANLPFLSRYLGSETVDPDVTAAAGIRQRLEERPGITLLELIDDGAAADDLYRMVATGAVYREPGAGPLGGHRPHARLPRSHSPRPLAGSAAVRALPGARRRRRSRGGARRRRPSGAGPGGAVHGLRQGGRDRRRALGHGQAGRARRQELQGDRQGMRRARAHVPALVRGRAEGAGARRQGDPGPPLARRTSRLPHAAVLGRT